MKSFKRTMFILGGSLLLLGIILAATGFLLGGEGHFTINRHGIVSGNNVIHINDKGGIVSDKYSLIKQDKIALGNIKAVKINTSYSKIEIIDSDDFYIEYTYLGTKNEVCHSVKDGILTYQEPTTNDGFSFFNFWDFDNDSDYYIKLYIPKNTTFESFTVDSSSGDVVLKNFTSKTLDITASYGDVKMDNINSTNTSIDLSSGYSKIRNFNTDSLEYGNSYGDAEFININSNSSATDDNKNGTIFLDLSSGEINMDTVNTSKLKMENSYGDIDLKSVSTMELVCDLSSGSIEAKDSDFGNVTIDNSYGDISMEFAKNISSYDYEIECDYGDISINDSDYEGSVTSENNHQYNINIDASSGDVDLKFKN